MNRRRKKLTDSDSVLKELVQTVARQLWPALFNRQVKGFLNIEFAATKQRRVDFLVEEEDSALAHLEVQSTNDPKMPWRELEYYGMIFEQTGRIPRQIVIYLGRGKMHMPARIEHPTLKFEYILFDIRTIDAAPLIASDEIEVNIIGFLCGDGATLENLRIILRNMGKLKGNHRKDMLAKLAMIVGLRMKREIFLQEAYEMGMRADIKDNLVLSGFFNDGVKQGRQEEGAKMLRMQLQTKFGKLPAWVLTFLQQAETKQLEEAGLRVLKATTLGEVIQSPKNGATKKKPVVKSANGTTR